MKRYILTTHENISEKFGLWNRENNERKALDVFTGLCLGILADGETNSRETQFLLKWIRANHDLLPSFVSSNLVPLLELLANDSEPTFRNLEEIKDLLGQIVGLGSADSEPSEFNPACGLMFDTACRKSILTVAGLEIVVSGSFVRGSIAEVIREITGYGGITRTEAPRAQTSFLVIGEKGSNQWATTIIGNKAQKALNMKETGHSIKIFREKDFFDLIGNFSEDSKIGILAEVDLSQLPLAGKTFVITGTLSLDRDEFKTLIESKGGKVTGSVSAKTSYVLAGEGGGSKRDKAEKLGVPIISEEELQSLIA